MLNFAYPTKSMNPESPIDLTPIVGKLESAAFELFRLWTAQLKGKPEIVIKDERKLVTDLKDAFETAIRKLQKKDRRGKPEGWDLGFVAGVIQGNLQTHWYHTYVAPTSEEYKTFAALKAIEAYLGFDLLASIRVDKLYLAFLTEDTNLDSIDENAFLKQIDTSETGKLDVISTEQTGKVLILMKNLIIEQIFRITNLKDEGVNLDVTNVFSWEEIEEVIAANHAVDAG